MGQLLGRAVLSPGWVREEEREVTGARSQPDDRAHPRQRDSHRDAEPEALAV